MGLWNKSPEETAAKEAAKAAAARRKEEQRKAEEARRQAEAFAASPAGRAKAAREAGQRLFQIRLPLTESKPFTVAMMGAYSNAQNFDNLHVLESIERQGWRLEHAGYVFIVTGSETRDKFLASGHQEAVSGRVE